LVTRTLVTTADERTWPKNKNQPILFLGEWCTLYDRKHIWKGLDYKIVPYHWHNKEKFSNDYYYLDAVYETILIDLRMQFNAIHNVNYSLKYWRILIGPWLGFFLQMLYDRWFMLKIAIAQYSINGVNIIDRDRYSMVPKDMNHFNSMFMGDDWNELIYGQIVENFFGDQLKINKIKIHTQEKIENKDNGFKFKLKNIIISLINLVNKMTSKNDEFFFIASYLPLIQDLKMQIALKQIPKRWRAENTPDNINTINASERDNLKLKTLNADSFVNIAINLFFKNIPSVYLEGYKKLTDIVNKNSWPTNPKVIFTSNAFHGSDYFKAWAAGKQDKGALLVIGQHGGMYGMIPFSFEESHQLAISDYWLSWGWVNSNNKIIPVANLKNLNSSLTNKNKGGGLLVTFVTPRYSYHMFSVILPSQWPDYFDDQCKFISSLPEIIQKEMKVRLFGDDRKWGQKSRWNDQFPNLKLDYGKQSMKSMVKKCRVFIASYNSTTYLETLAWNVPTIAFWNPNSWDLIDEVKDDFYLLKKVKILHDTPESAAKHLAEIWEDVPQWWQSKEVQQAREAFCRRWSYVDEDSFDKLYKALKEISG
jgi:putative transferase (TIGR04331 family)